VLYVLICCGRVSSTVSGRRPLEAPSVFDECQNVSRPCVERGALFGCPIVSLINPSDPAAAAADVVQHGFRHLKRTRRCCKPVANVRRRVVNAPSARGAGLVPPNAALFSASTVALSSAAFAFDQPADGLPQK
jgi:hypothetical protein